MARDRSACIRLSKKENDFVTQIADSSHCNKTTIVRAALHQFMQDYDKVLCEEIRTVKSSETVYKLTLRKQNVYGWEFVYDTTNDNLYTILTEIIKIANVYVYDLAEYLMLNKTSHDNFVVFKTSQGIFSMKLEELS